MSSLAGPSPARTADDASVYAIERPDSRLWTYYLLCCLPLVCFPPAALVVGLIHWFRYHTMRYRFDAEGITMRWGILFRREVILNYARIQDIHLVSNFVERWLGLARIQIQTASGNATPEMTIEGVQQFEHLRDFLYVKMRGIQAQPMRGGDVTSETTGLPPTAIAASEAELIAVLQSVTAELRGLRMDLAARNPSATEP